MDIGGGTTDIAIFEKGALWHTAVLQVGGEHFTNDVAVALRTPVERGREDQEEARLRAHLDGARGGLDRGPERRRPQAADHGPPGAGRRDPGARRGDLPDGADRDPPRRLRPLAQQRRRAHRRRRRSSRACRRSPSRSSTCRSGAARPRGSAGSSTWWRARCTRPPWAWSSPATGAGWAAASRLRGRRRPGPSARSRDVSWAGSRIFF